MPQASSALASHLNDGLRSAPRDASLAIVFPGQGSHQVAAGRDLYDAYPLAREVFRRADETLAIPLTKLCFEGPEDQLRDTANAQPAILTVSLACLAAALESGALRRQPAFVAGHSLGEVSALAAARQELRQQIIRPVLWRQSVLKMTSAGATTFVEAGPGRVLSGLVKRAG